MLDEEIQSSLDENTAQNEKELVAQVEINQKSISMQLHSKSKIQNEGKWIPRRLTEESNVKLTSACFS